MNAKITQVRHYSATFRGLAAMVACVFLLGNLANFLHFATVQHTTCDEHGESIHLESAHAGTLSDVAPSAGGDNTVALYASPPIESNHEHDHCFICSSLRERVGITSDTSPSALTFSEGKALASVESFGQPPSITLYHLAPKNSPPLS